MSGTVKKTKKQFIETESEWIYVFFGVFIVIFMINMKKIVDIDYFLSLAESHRRSTCKPKKLIVF